MQMFDIGKLSKRRQEKQQMQEQILEICDHPNIEKFIESFEVEGKKYIVRRHLPGDNLIEHIQ